MASFSIALGALNGLSRVEILILVASHPIIVSIVLVVNSVVTMGLWDMENFMSEED